MRRHLPSRLTATLAALAVLVFVVFIAEAAFGGAETDSASASGEAPNGTCGFCALAPSGESLKLTGSGSTSLSKANVIVNSTGKPAVAVTGSGSIEAPSVGVAGTVSITGSGTVQNLTTGIASIGDPLGGLAVPSLTVPSPVPSVSVTGSSGKTISPGVYKEITDTGSGGLTLSSGTYVVLGKFANTGSGAVTAQGVTLYLACSSYPTPCKSGEQGASLTLTGSGPLKFTGPEEGCSPVSVFADRNSTAALSITGSASQTLDGVIYAKSGSLTVTGSGSTFVIGGPIVVGSATLTGNGNISVTGALPLTEGLGLSLSAAPTSARIGETETLTATLSCHGAPMANQPVTFSVTGANPNGGSATTSSSGVATLSYKGTATGTDSAQASYTGGGTSVTSAPVTVKWAKAQPTITTKVKSASVNLGEPIADTATVAGGASPTGTVTFNVFAASDTSCKTPLNAQPLTASLSSGQASSPQFTPTAAGAYQFLATYGGDASNEPATGKCGEASEQVIVNPTIGPVTGQPSSVTVNEGQSASFTAAALANPAASVVWQVSSNEGKSWSDDTTDTASTSSESGKTTSTLTVKAATRSQNAFEYRAVFTNAAGSVTSNAATLTVDWIGPVTSQPENQAVSEGHQVTFTAVVSSNPAASIQWQISTNEGKSWSNDTTDGGNTTGTLTIKSPTLAQSGYEYRAVFTNAVGVLDSNAATLTVQTIGPVTGQPSSVTVDEGQSASFTAAASANPAASVQWQVSSNGGSQWENDTADEARSSSTGETRTGTLTIAAASRGKTGDQYRAVFTNAAGSVTSNAATLTVDWIGPLTSQPQSQTVSEGQSATFTVSASNNPASTVRWEVSSTGGLGWELDTSDKASTVSEPGQTTSILTVGSARGDSGYEYRAVLTNAAGTVTSSAATLTVNWIGPIEAQPASQTVNEDKPASFTVTAPASPAASVQWQLSSNEGKTWANDGIDSTSTSSAADDTSSTLTVASASRADNGIQYRAVLTNAAGSVTSNAATLTVDWVGPVEAQPHSQTADEGQPASFTTVAAANPGASVQWQQSGDGGHTWSNDTSDSASTSTASGKTTTTLTVASATRALSGEEYRALFTNAVGSVTSSSASLMVDWIGPVTVQPESQTIAEGKPVSFTAVADASPVASVQWQLSSDSGVTWSDDATDAATTTSSSGQTTGVLAIASASSSQNGYEYRAVFTNAAGSATSSLAILTVEKTTLCTDTYTGPNNGLWQTSANWSTGRTPTSKDVACVDAGTTVDATGGANEAGVLLDLGGLLVSGGTLELTGIPEFAHTPGLESSTTSELTLTGGTLSLGSAFDTTSQFAATGEPTVSGTGKLILEPGVTGTIGSGGSCSTHPVLSGVTLENDGTLKFGQSADVGAGAIAMENGAQLVNAGTFDDNSYDSGCGYGLGGEQLTIYNAGGTAPSVTNTGTFQAEAGSGTLNVSVPFSSQGTVKALSGTLGLTAGGGGTQGSWAASANSTLAFTGGTFVLTEGTFSGTGTVAVAGGTVTATGVSAAAGANTTVSAGSLSIPAGSSTAVSALTLTGGTVDVGGELEATSAFAASGQPTVSGAGKLLVGPGATGTVGNGASCSVHLSLSEATFENQGTLTFGEGTDVGAGAIAMQNGAQLVNTGTFDDNSYDSGCGYGLGGEQLTIYDNGGATPSVTNTGTFQGQAGSQTLNVAVPFSNGGTTSALSGTLALTAGGAGTAGDWTASAGATLAFTGGSFSLGEGDFSGAGTVAIAGGAVTATALHASIAAVTAGSLTIPTVSTSSIAALTLGGGTVSVGGELDATSSLVVDGSTTVSGAGKLVVGSGAVGTLGSAALCSAHLSLSEATLENQGTLTFGQGAGVGAGAISMQDGAQLVNVGTFNDNSYDSGCGFGVGGEQYAIYSTGGASPSITNTGTFQTEAGTTTLNVSVPFTNDGTVRQQNGTLEFTGGGIPNEVASGCWFTQSDAATVLKPGTFLIEEGCVFQVREEGATVIFAPNGLSGELEAHPFAGGTVTISGHGEDSHADAKLASVTIEATLSGHGQWQPICEPITPNASGNFSCEWSTASGAYPNGEYELRAKLTDNSGCPKSALTKPIVSKVTNTQLLLEPRNAGPDAINSTQTLTATFSDTHGEPVPGKTVTLEVQGANHEQLEALTNSAGIASFSYKGVNEGQDTAQASTSETAGGPTIVSNKATVKWFAPLKVITSTPVQGNFFYANGAINGFSAKPGDTPAFSETFPSINFDPPSITPTPVGEVRDSDSGPFAGAGAVVFDGAGALVSQRTPITRQTGWTLEAWINPSSLSQDGIAVYNGDNGGNLTSGGNGYGFGVGGEGGHDGSGGCLVGLEEEVTWIDSGYCFPSTDHWYHVVETDDEGLVSFYVNGSRVYSGSQPTPKTPSGMMIGGYGASGPRDFLGEISNVAFYATPLSASQVRTHYNTATAESSTGQPAYASAVEESAPALYLELKHGVPAASNPWFVDQETRPFTDLTTDELGRANGEMAAHGNNLQAGVGALEDFDAAFTAEYVVGAAGDVTFDVTSRDGFLLGIGGGATSVSAPNENAPSSNETPFTGLPLVASVNRSCCSTPQTYAVTVHFPAAGSYPYELDYFQHSGGQLSLVMKAASFTAESSPLTVYTGYADTVRPPDGIFPFPWQGAANTSFVGAGPIFDTGGLRFDNSSNSPQTLEQVSVDIGNAHFSPWLANQVVPAHGILVLAGGPEQPDCPAVPTIGPVAQVTPPPSLLPGEFTSSTEIRFFCERHEVTLTESLAVNEVREGPTEIAAETTVNSYMLRDDSPQGGELTGSVKLESPVLGVITSDANLDKSDYLGVPGTVYPTGVSERGLESGDTAIIGEDDLTVTMTSSFSEPGDEARIITAPTSGAAVASTNFNTSAAEPGTCSSPSHLIPQVHVTVDGSTTTYEDTGQVLNTGGIQPAECSSPGNASEPWTRIGGGGVPIEAPLPPAVSLQLTPTTITGDEVGERQTLTVTARDASDKPVAGLPIDLHIFGPNAKEISVTTNAAGVAESFYVGSRAGQDTVSATASISGRQVASNQLTVPWAVPETPKLPPAPPPRTETEPPAGVEFVEPPFVESLHPDGGSIVTGPTRVTATISGGPLTLWKATLTPAGGGSPITLGEGHTAPPETLGTIEPAVLSEGTYRLAVTAETTGGSGSESAPITVGTTPGIPAPPPTHSSSGAPTLTEITPGNGSVIGVTTAVYAKATAPAGQTISAWSATLEPHGGGPATTLAESNEEQPTPLATIDPSQFASGTYTLTVTVHASGGGYATVSETVTLGTGATTSEEGGPAATPPEIGEVSPANGTVVTTPVPIKASVHAPEGESIASWTVAYQGSHDQSATTLAQGKGAPPETLASFDPTKLPNDTYTVTVAATTSGGAVQSQSSSLIVSGNLKLGRFLQTYKDLEVPVSGFDMRLERVYDSTDKSVGDFGVGWHLLLSSFTVATNGPLGEGGWSAQSADCTFSICGYAYESSPSHTVTVTWPDKHQEVFDFTPTGEQLNNIEVQPAFTARPGTNTTSTLEVDEPSEIINGFDGNLYNSDFTPWTATRFLLTTRTGQKFVLDTESGLVSEEDRSGNKLTVTPNGIESSSGPALSFMRDSQGRITEVTGPSGQHLHYGYDAAGNLSSYTDADGNTTTYSYDSEHDLLATTGPGASKPLQQLAYDSEGRLSEVIGADGSVEHISTNVGARTETIADPNGKLTEIETYDALGNPIEETKAFEGKTLAVKHTYDSEGHVLSSTDPDGNTTSEKWENGNLVAQTDANGDTTTFEYNPSGQLTDVIGPSGTKQSAVTYDANGNPTKIENADGSTQMFTYNSEGLPTSIAHPSGVTEKITYDSHGYPATVTSGEGTSHFTYSPSGELESVADEAGRKTTYSYDGDGNLTSVTDGEGNMTKYTYNTLGEPLTVTDPLGHAEAFEYDEAGLRTKRIDRDGETTTYAYDADRNLVAESSSDGEERTIVYDGLERPISISNQTQTLGFAYDGDGRITEATTSAIDPAPAVTLKYTYDANGNRTSMIGPDGTTSYGYDALSRLTSVSPSTEPTGASFKLGYTPSGYLATVARPDGIDDSLTYNGEELTARIASSGAGAVVSSDYGYTSSGLRSSSSETGGLATSFAYDPLDELTEEAPAAGGEATHYEYDLDGNRAKRSGPAGSSTYTYNADDELTSSGTESFSYNADGELTQRTVLATGATTTYEWRAREQLLSVHLPDGSTETFAYDPLGRRVATTHDGATTVDVYDHDSVHLEYEPGSTTPSAVYTDGAHTNQVLEMLRGGHRYSYLVNGEGSTIALADEHGDIVQRYSYDAFGQPSSSGSVQNPFLYTGQQWDPESGIYYERAREYAPDLGRFLSGDPVAHVNPYLYTANDPTNEVDPLGTQEFSIAEFDVSSAIENIITAIPVATFAGVAVVAADELLRDEVQSKIPSSWGEGQPAKKGEGWEWVDPENPNNRVRVDPGDEDLPEGYAGQEDHVHVESGGSSLDENGEIAPDSNAKAPEAHIPLERYLEWETWNSPEAVEGDGDGE